MNILLLMDNRGDSNWGSQATTNQLVHLLRSEYPGCEVRGLPRSAARPSSGLTRRLTECVAPRAAQRGVFSGGIAGVAFNALTSGMTDLLEWCDTIVVNAEGTLHPQRQTLRWVPALLWIRSHVRKPMWIVNCSVQFVGSPTEELYKKLLTGAECFVVREPVSYREAQAAGISAVQGADCAFKTVPLSTINVSKVRQKYTEGQPYIVMTGSATVKHWPLEAQISLIRFALEAGRRVIYASSTQEDLGNYRALAKRINLPLVSDSQLDYQEFAGLLAQADGLIGGRFHPLILSAVAGTPFLAFGSNTHKMAGIVEMLGCRDMLFEMQDVTSQKRGLRKLFDDGPNLGSALRDAASYLSEQAALNACKHCV